MSLAWVSAPHRAGSSMCVGFQVAILAMAVQPLCSLYALAVSEKIKAANGERRMLDTGRRQRRIDRANHLSTRRTSVQAGFLLLLLPEHLPPTDWRAETSATSFYCVKDFIQRLTRHFHHHAIHVALLLVSRRFFDRWCNNVQDVENSTPHIRADRRCWRWVYGGRTITFAPTALQRACPQSLTTQHHRMPNCRHRLPDRSGRGGREYPPSRPHRLEFRPAELARPASELSAIGQASHQGRTLAVCVSFHAAVRFRARS